MNLRIIKRPFFVLLLVACFAFAAALFAYPTAAYADIKTSPETGLVKTEEGDAESIRAEGNVSKMEEGAFGNLDHAVAKGPNNCTSVSDGEEKDGLNGPKQDDLDNVIGKSEGQNPGLVGDVSLAENATDGSESSNEPAIDKKGLEQDGASQNNAEIAAVKHEDAVAFMEALSAVEPNMTAQAGGFVIVIDPGHGGYDGGASGYVVEKDVNLAISQYLYQELIQYSGVKVFMTRTNDSFVELGDRVNMAVKWGANLVLSIHNNAGGGRGSEVIVPNSSSWRYTECHTQGQRLGNNILSELRGVGLSVHSGVYSKDSTNNSRYADGSLSDYFTLVAGPREHGILGIIIEHAFVDNASDASFLQGASNLRNLALADARGVVKTYGLSKVDPTTVTYEAPLEAGTYVIASAVDSRQVLDVEGGKKNNGANALLWGYHGSAWQQWAVSYDAKGRYTIKSVNSNKVLDAAGGTAGQGVNVLTWEGRSSNYFNQRWVLSKSGNGFVVKSLLNPYFVLDCCGGSATNGTNLELWGEHGGINQTFYFVKVSNVAFGRTIADGTYTIGVSSKQTQLIEVQGGSKSNSANVDLYASHGGDNQKWRLSYNGSGYYNIINVKSGLLLDVDGSKLAPGANVLQYKAHGGKNQLWGIRQNNDGTFSIFSALSGMSLDVTGGSTSNKTNVETWMSHGGANQSFVLTPVSSGYAIMGAASASRIQMINYYKSTGASYPSAVYSSKGASTVDDFVDIAILEANAEGVKAEVLFAQAMLETGNLRFGGSVQPNQCNFGGIGATDTNPRPASFANVRQGLRAQVQHLKAYASTAGLKNSCVDPRFNLVSRGSATTVEMLSGKWASDSSYGSKIVTIISNIMKK